MEQDQANKGAGSIVWIIFIVVIVAGLGGFAYVSQQSKSQSEQAAMIKEKEGAAMVQEKADALLKEQAMKKEGEIVATSTEGVMMKKEDVMIKKDESAAMVKYSGAVLAGTQAKVLDFNQADYEIAKKANKTILLYFYANWCPTCKAEVPKMYQAFNGLTNDLVVAFRVNFNDDQTDEVEKGLAREFGVAYQHTKVIIKDGQRVLKSPETWTQERYVSEVTKLLTN